MINAMLLAMTLMGHLAAFPEFQHFACDFNANVSTNVRNHIVQRSKVLEDRLKVKIFGQDAAVKETAHAVIRFAAGVNDPNTPVASLLYCGPSGVGKTELAKQLAIELYGSESHLFRINMSEFSEPHSISRLIGAPPGYVGYDLGGSLANYLRTNPCSVILLDEIEKGHPKILKLFMHVFDAGYFTSAQGQDVDCRHAIFILTTNIAASEIAIQHQRGLTAQQILHKLQPQLMEVLSPEMYNRLDCMVFLPLGDEIFENLVRKMLREVKLRLLRAKEIDICFDPSIINYLKQYTLDPKLGARPLKRIIEKEISTVLAQAIIEHSYKKDDVLLCSYSHGTISLDLIFSAAD